MENVHNDKSKNYIKVSQLTINHRTHNEANNETVVAKRVVAAWASKQS